MEKNKKFVAALDIGSTNVKCFIYDENFQIIGKAVNRMTVKYSELVRCEIEPDRLWECITSAVRNAIRDGNVSVTNIACLGISSQRGTFITWNKNTQVPYHNFVSWRDKRGEKLVDRWNNCILMKVTRLICYCLYWITGNIQFLLIATFKFTNAEVTFKLIWLLNNLPDLKKADKRDVMFGTIDCWLLYKLTGGKTHCIDFSCAASTGMFDPFRKKWAIFLPWLGIPSAISLPSVCQSMGYHFGAVDSEIWGAPIPITCMMADQMASIFGSGCFDTFDTKITLGTGGFFDVNTGSNIRVSKNGLYPLIGWATDEEIVYVLEGACHDVGTLIEWAKSMDLFHDVSHLSETAFAINNLDNLYFMPTPNLQKCTEGNPTEIKYNFVGFKETMSKHHMIRAILESIVFQLYRIYRAYEIDNVHSAILLWIDGGVSRNDFVCQSLADLIGVYIKRSACTDCSASGVAFSAGLTAGIWKDKSDIRRYMESDKIFVPDVKNGKILLEHYHKWEDYTLNQFRIQLQ